MCMNVFLNIKSLRVPFTTDRAVIALNPSLNASEKHSGVSNLFHRNYVFLELDQNQESDCFPSLPLHSERKLFKSDSTKTKDNDDH